MILGYDAFHLVALASLPGVKQEKTVAVGGRHGRQSQGRVDHTILLHQAPRAEEHDLVFRHCPVRTQVMPLAGLLGRVVGRSEGRGIDEVHERVHRVSPLRHQIQGMAVQPGIDCDHRVGQTQGAHLGPHQEVTTHARRSRVPLRHRLVQGITVERQHQGNGVPVGYLAEVGNRIDFLRVQHLPRLAGLSGLRQLARRDQGHQPAPHLRGVHHAPARPQTVQGSPRPRNGEVADHPRDRGPQIQGTSIVPGFVQAADQHRDVRTGAPDLSRVAYGRDEDLHGATPCRRGTTDPLVASMSSTSAEISSTLRSQEFSAASAARASCCPTVSVASTSRTSDG